MGLRVFGLTRDPGLRRRLTFKVADAATRSIARNSHITGVSIAAGSNQFCEHTTDYTGFICVEESKPKAVQHALLVRGSRRIIATKATPADPD